MKGFTLSFLSMSLVALLLFPGAISAAQLQAMEARYALLRQVDDAASGKSDLDRARLIGSEFDRLFPDLEPASALSDHDLPIAFKAANTAVFYTDDQKHAAILARLFAELERRGMTTPKHAESMQAAYVQTRMFDEAIELQHAYPVLEALPVMVGEKKTPRSVWAFHPTRNEISLEPARLGNGPAIVVITQPACRFSQNAFRTIEGDTELHALFAEHARLIAPSPRRFDVALFQQWNREHPDLAMRLAYDRAQWPQLETWSTPTFYFFRDGRLQAIVEGWPEGGRKDEVLASARKIGLP